MCAWSCFPNEYAKHNSIASAEIKEIEFNMSNLNKHQNPKIANYSIAKMCVACVCSWFVWLIKQHCNYAKRILVFFKSFVQFDALHSATTNDEFPQVYIIACLWNKFVKKVLWIKFIYFIWIQGSFFIEQIGDHFHGTINLIPATSEPNTIYHHNKIGISFKPICPLYYYYNCNRYCNSL